MKVTTERIPESQVVLHVEVDEERLQGALDSAYRRLAAKTHIPGFRPGKAPRAVVERHLGEHRLLHEAIDRLVPEVYKEALEKEALEPVDYPDTELVTEEPLVVKFTVPVRPTVELEDYRSLRLPRAPVEVPPEQVQDQLEALRRRYATIQPVTRPIAWGDIVRADVLGSVEGEPFVREEDAEFRLLAERPVLHDGFAQALLGREKGAEFQFEATLPEDFVDERLRGKQAHYQVRIKEVKEELLPELDDEFARQVGEGFPSREALRSRIQEDLRQELERQAEQRYQEQALDALVERSRSEYPPVLVERQVDRLLREELGAGRRSHRRGQPEAEREAIERYLRQVGKSEEELRAELRPLAEARVRRSLVLSQLAEAEHIQVSDPELEGEIERLISGAGTEADQVRRLFSSEDAREGLRSSLLTRRTLERLAEIASAGAPPSPEEAQETEDEQEDEEE